MLKFYSGILVMEVAGIVHGHTRVRSIPRLSSIPPGLSLEFYPSICCIVSNQ